MQAIPTITHIDISESEIGVKGGYSIVAALNTDDIGGGYREFQRP